MKPKVPWIEAECAHCKTKWEIMPAVYRRRIKVSLQKKIFCTHNCAAAFMNEQRKVRDSEIGITKNC